MDKNSFWHIVESSKINLKVYCPEEHTKCLKRELNQLSLDELSSFETTRWKLMNQSYTCSLWDASVLITKDDSDEVFYGFRTGLMFQGEDVFLNSIRLPDQVLSNLWGVDKFEDCASLGYAAQVVYEEKTGDTESSIPLLDEKITFPVGEPRGKSISHESELLRERYPKLYKQYIEQ